MWDRFKSWHSGLSKTGKVILWSITAVVAGSAINAAASPDTTSTTSNTKPATGQQQSAQKPEARTPTITTKTDSETSSIPFATSTIEDSGLDKGKTEVRTVGINGLKTSTYEITYSDGEQTDKKLIKEEITKKPTNEVIANGTYVAPAPKPNCDPNYSGACVPNVYPADVDCAGGSGNGPYYVQGPVYVVGTDHYHLDGDHNGVACQ